MSPLLMLYTSLLETDPTWQRGGGQVNVSRRFIISAALLSVSGVCVAMIVLPVLYALLAPVPFEYRNLPFQVCSPTSTLETCAPLGRDDVFHPGDIVPFIVDRCSTDPFAHSATMPYLVSRNLVNDVTMIRIILPSLATDVPSAGCSASITFAHQLPDAVPPGRYYLEGVATIYGRFRTINAYFRTQVFEVVPKQPLRDADG